MRKRSESKNEGEKSLKYGIVIVEEILTMNNEFKK